MLNGAVSLLIGFYLIAVLWNGNENKLYSTIKEESGFFKWIGAILILNYISRVAGDKAGGIINSLGLLALMALMLGQGDKIFAQFGELFGEQKK